MSSDSVILKRVEPVDVEKLLPVYETEEYAIYKDEEKHMYSLQYKKQGSKEACLGSLIEDLLGAQAQLKVYIKELNNYYVLRDAVRTLFKLI